MLLSVVVVVAGLVVYRDFIHSKKRKRFIEKISQFDENFLECESYRNKLKQHKLHHVKKMPFNRQNESMLELFDGNYRAGRRRWMEKRSFCGKIKYRSRTGDVDQNRFGRKCLKGSEYVIFIYYV